MEIKLDEPKTVADVGDDISLAIKSGEHEAKIEAVEEKIEEAKDEAAAIDERTEEAHTRINWTQDDINLINERLAELESKLLVSKAEPGAIEKIEAPELEEKKPEDEAIVIEEPKKAVEEPEAKKPEKKNKAYFF